MKVPKNGSFSAPLRRPDATNDAAKGTIAITMQKEKDHANVNLNSPTVNDEIHAPMGGVRDSCWGRTGPRSLDDFSDLIWINSHSGQRQYPF